MKYLLLLTLMGCMKSKSPIEHARADLVGQSDCLNMLRTSMKNTGCERVRVQQNRNSVIIQCEKPDEERGEFWDRYIFRISDARLKIPQKFAEQIDSQTICIDKYTRIEAFKP